MVGVCNVMGRVLAVILIVCVLPSCRSRAGLPIGEPALTPEVTRTIPTVTPPAPAVPAPASASCADLDAAWGKDWPATIRVIDELIASQQTCGAESLFSKKYAALFSYAVVLENEGQLREAIEHYTTAFDLDPHRREAWDALARLQHLPAPTPIACLPESSRLDTPYITPSSEAGQYVAVRDGELVMDGQPFLVRGVNYYPRFTPWHRFLTETDRAEMAHEFDLIHRAGFNTIRIFLWYDALFMCQPEEAVPVVGTFAVVDAVLALARERDLKVIVTLNDLPDLTYRPLYMDWERYDAQTAFIVRRYKEEPAILAWDLRNEGDLDYGARSPSEARFTQEQVLDWLANVSRLVKEIDRQHLLTAGWWGDPIPTGPYVDILSFHHWYDAQALQLRIADYQAQTGQPLLLEEVGYHSWAQADIDARDEPTQAELLRDVTHLAEAQGLSGWMIWTAFDFAPPDGQSPTHEHFFGVWHSDLSPKPVLSMLPLK